MKKNLFLIIEGILLFWIGACNYVRVNISYLGLIITIMPIMLIPINVLYIKKEKIKNEKFYNILISEYIFLQILGLIFSMNNVRGWDALGDLCTVIILTPITAITWKIISDLRNKMLKGYDLEIEANKIIRGWFYTVEGIILLVIGASYNSSVYLLLEGQLAIIIVNILIIKIIKIKDSNFYNIIINEYFACQVIAMFIAVCRAFVKLDYNALKMIVSVYPWLIPAIIIHTIIIRALRNKMLKNNTNIDKIESKEGENKGK